MCISNKFPGDAVATECGRDHTLRTNEYENVTRVELLELARLKGRLGGGNLHDKLGYSWIGEC